MTHQQRGWRLITVGVVRGGVVKFEVLPQIDGFIMTATLEFPEGTPPSVTREALDRVDAALRKNRGNASEQAVHSCLKRRNFASRLYAAGQTPSDVVRSLEREYRDELDETPGVNTVKSWVKLRCIAGMQMRFLTSSLLMVIGSKTGSVVILSP